MGRVASHCQWEECAPHNGGHNDTLKKQRQKKHERESLSVAHLEFQGIAIGAEFRQKIL